jgi:hypothetical protein
MRVISRITLCAAAMCLLGGVLSAADGKLMHCFYFTPVAQATQADWDAFYKATNALPGKIPGLTAAWAGKLRRPMGEGENGRQYGVCMAMKDEATLKTYSASPAHKEWVEVYSKVRQEGTTTVDIVVP